MTPVVLFCKQDLEQVSWRVVKKNFPKTVPNILGDSQSIGRISVNRWDASSNHKIDETISSKGFHRDQKLLKKFLACRLAMYDIKTKQYAQGHRKKGIYNPRGGKYNIKPGAIQDRMEWGLPNSVDDL